jgi:PilZ domain
VNERRAEPRLMCSELIQVRLAGVARPGLTANLEDISLSGACVQTEEPLPAGAAVDLRCGRRRFRGHVKYCLETELGYFAGIQFEAGQKWSRADYEPKHLLDARTLIPKDG